MFIKVFLMFCVIVPSILGTNVCKRHSLFQRTLKNVHIYMATKVSKPLPPSQTHLTLVL